MEPTLFPQKNNRNILNALRENGVSLVELNVLRQSGAKDAESILGLIESFPNIAISGLINSAEISYAVSQVIGGENFARISSDISEDKSQEDPMPPVLGAIPDPEFRWKIGDIVPLEPSAAQYLEQKQESDNYERLDARACLPWPVRNQGQRGTCVSFATTAIAEIQQCQNGSPIDLSEQFLYWAIKAKGNDGIPHLDGTWIRFALSELKSSGISSETNWPYDPNPIIGNPGHMGMGQPSSQAIQDAANRRIANTTYRNKPKNASKDIIQWLKLGRAVAISMPVFKDPISGITNWNTPAANGLGIVIDPPPTSVMSGGHAVCVTGYIADSSEPTGGYFIIRNSWGTSWGRRLPSVSAHGPEPGYGQISATYIDQFLMEYGVLT